MKHKILPVGCLVLVLGIVSACATQQKDVIYEYVYEKDDSFVLVKASNQKEDVITQLGIRRHHTTSLLMEEQNIMLSEAEVLLYQQFEEKQQLAQEWETAAFLCVGCDIDKEETEGVFASIHLSRIESEDSTPHLGYWETVHFDVTEQSNFSMDNATMQVIMEEYQLTQAYMEGAFVSKQALLDNEAFPFHEFMKHAAIYQKVREIQPIAAKQREMNHYPFMDIAWFVPNFQGLEFQSAPGYDNVVVPWNYCLDGSYQSQRTGYWSACTKVSMLVYDMFGEYTKYLPVVEALEYEVSEGYRLARGMISTTKWLSLIEQASEAVEIPTPFDLNTFRIGHGFQKITMEEVKTNGSIWEYELTKVDDTGFYLEVYSYDENRNNRLKESFTYFAGEGFDDMYQELLENGTPIN